MRIIILGGGTVGSWIALSAESGSVGVAIGPEGGFSVREITDSIVAGWTPLQLGSRILRIETAAMAVAAQLLLGR